MEKLNFNLEVTEHGNNPFDYWIVDDFLDYNVAKDISQQFLNYEEEEWVGCDGWIAKKKICNKWDRFPPLTYKTFFNLLSDEFTERVSKMTGCEPLYPDIGLHGGGWHMHTQGGNLSVHLDYSIHPKMNLQRKINLILYLEEGYESEWGGDLELWSHNPEKNKPGHCVKSIEAKFNRAVFFDTTQNSWHGVPSKLNCPPGKARKSFAVYYLTELSNTAVDRFRAHYVET